MFKCDQEHTIDSTHFVHCIGQTCSKLRKEFGRSFDYLIVCDTFYRENARSITVNIDNISWHREITDDTKPPQTFMEKTKDS